MFKLLVVDDEPDLLHSMKEWLQSKALVVDVARTAQQGLELARQLHPDAVILSLLLGDVARIEVIDRLRDFDPRLPVILITANAATETAIEAIERGGSDVALAPAASLAGLVDFTETLLRTGERDVYRRVCLEMDRVVLRTVLHHVNGNQVKASELLGISRTTLRAKLRDLNLGGEKPPPADAGDAQQTPDNGR